VNELFDKIFDEFLIKSLKLFELLEELLRRILEEFLINSPRLLELLEIVVETSILFMEMEGELILPLTSNLFKGLVIPIPIFPLELTTRPNCVS